MDKQQLLSLIITQLETDYRLLQAAAEKSHAAATHSENIPDNKYETLALEASYIAQGQANRAQEIRRACEAYRLLPNRTFGDDDPIRLGALVQLATDEGLNIHIFLGPAAGGLKVFACGVEIIVITPESPLGQRLLGQEVGDQVSQQQGKQLRTYEILSLS